MTLRWNLPGCPPGPIQRMPLHGTSRSTIGMHRYRSSRPLRPRSSRFFMPLRNWICSVNRGRPRRIQPVNMCEHSSHPAGVINCSGAGPVCGESEASHRKPTSEEGFLRLQLSGDCLLKVSRTAGAMRERRIREMELRTCPLPLGSDNWRNELLYRAGDIERHPGPKRTFFASSRRLVAGRSAHHCTTLRWGRCRIFKIFESQRHPWARRAPQSRSSRIGSPLRSLSFETCFASGTLGPGQAGTLISETPCASGAILWC